MIYQFARALSGLLAAQKFPIRVEYGPEFNRRSAHEENLVVVERDREQGDLFSAPRGAQRNPKKLATRAYGAKATIWIRSNLPGARLAEHEEACEQAVDAFFCGLYHWTKTTRHEASPTIVEARYIKAEEADVASAQTWPGVVYLFRFRVFAGVADLSYKGEGLPTGTLAARTSVIHVRRKADDPPEIVET